MVVKIYGTRRAGVRTSAKTSQETLNAARKIIVCKGTENFVSQKLLCENGTYFDESPKW